MEAGRLLVFGCFLLLPLCCVLILRRAGVDLLSSLPGALLLTSNSDFLPWNASARPDIPALFFELAALFFISFEGDLGTVAAGLCIASAVLTKVSFVAGGLAITVFFLWAKRWRAGVIFVAAAALPVVLAYAVLQMRGDPALHHLSLLRHAATDAMGAGKLLVTSFAVPVRRVMLALGLASLIPVFLVEGRRRILALYFLTSWVLGAMAMIQVGGNINYLFSAWTATALLAAISISNLRSRWKEMPAIAVLVLLAVFALDLGAGAWTATRMVRRRGDLTESHLAGVFRGQEILSDVSYLAAQSKNPMFLDPFLAHNLEEAETWSPAPIISLLNQRHWDVVMQKIGADGEPAAWRHFRSFSPGIQAAINRNYEPVASCSGIMVRLPKESSGPVEPSPELRSLRECDFRPAPQPAMRAAAQ